MGERVTVGPLTFNVLDSTWKSQLGELPALRMPNNRFLILTISVTNGGGSEVSFPMLTLEGQGQTIKELESGEGIEGWLGIIRSIAPAQTLQGKIMFDVPLGTYKLKVTDGGEPGREKIAFVEIPLRMEHDQPITPLPR